MAVSKALLFPFPVLMSVDFFSERPRLILRAARGGTSSSRLASSCMELVFRIRRPQTMTLLSRFPAKSSSFHMFHTILSNGFRAVTRKQGLRTSRQVIPLGSPSTIAKFPSSSFLLKWFVYVCAASSLRLVPPPPP